MEQLYELQVQYAAKRKQHKDLDQVIYCRDLVVKIPNFIWDFIYSHCLISLSFTQGFIMGYDTIRQKS